MPKNETYCQANIERHQLIIGVGGNSLADALERLAEEIRAKGFEKGKTFAGAEFKAQGTPTGCIIEMSYFMQPDERGQDEAPKPPMGFRSPDRIVVNTDDTLPPGYVLAD